MVGGRSVEELDRLELTDNTLFIFSSDNGGVQATNRRIDHAEIQGHRINGALRGQKTEVYEGGHRVPFVVRWPNHVNSNVVSDALVANTDLLATFAELLDRKLPADAGEDSFSMLGTLLGRRTGKPSRQSLVTDSVMGTFAIQEGPWKLIQGQGSGGRSDRADGTAHSAASEPAGQLYNLADDLGETTNLYEKEPAIVTRLTRELERIKREGRSRP